MPELKASRGRDLLQGERITLAASAARTATAGTNGTAYVLNGERMAIGIQLKYTAKATEVDDTCDVYIDFLGPDGTNWLNAVHFTQALGTGADAETQYALLIPNAGTTAPIVVTADAAVGTIRPEVFGSQIRARWVIVNPGGGAASFTFSVYAYAL